MEYKSFVYKLVCVVSITLAVQRANYTSDSTDTNMLPRQHLREKCIYKHILQLGWEHVKIVLVEEVLYKNRQELLRKESEYIEKHKCDMFCLLYHR